MFPLQHKWKKTKGGNFKKVYGYYVYVKDYGKIWKDADVEERILYFYDVIWGKPVPEDHFIDDEHRRRILYMTTAKAAQGKGLNSVRKKLNKRIDEHNKIALKYGKRKED